MLPLEFSLVIKKRTVSGPMGMSSSEGLILTPMICWVTAAPYGKLRLPNF
jgi:hypothetical protein